LIKPVLSPADTGFENWFDRF